MLVEAGADPEEEAEERGAAERGRVLSPQRGLGLATLLDTPPIATTSWRQPSRHGMTTAPSPGPRFRLPVDFDQVRLAIAGCINSKLES